MKTLVILAWMTAIPAAAAAQPAIAGSVRDGSGAPIAGIVVEALSPELIEKTRTAVTDGAGRYRIEDLHSGVYIVTFSVGTEIRFRQERIELKGSSTATVDARLSAAPFTETI